MKCVTEFMTWIDWASVALLYSLGVWKMVELINKSGKWAERIINKDRDVRLSQTAESKEK